MYIYFYSNFYKKYFNYQGYFFYDSKVDDIMIPKLSIYFQ